MKRSSRPTCFEHPDRHGRPTQLPDHGLGLGDQQPTRSERAAAGLLEAALAAQPPHRGGGELAGPFPVTPSSLPTWAGVR